MLLDPRLKEDTAFKKSYLHILLSSFPLSLFIAKFSLKPVQNNVSQLITSVFQLLLSLSVFTVSLYFSSICLYTCISIQYLHDD